MKTEARYGNGAVILVTGASGFLGLKLVKRLAKDGNEVIALVREVPSFVSALSHKIKWMQIDLSEPNLELNSLPNLDAIVHLAGNKGRIGGSVSKPLIDNEIILINLLQKIASKSKLVVFASSQMVYGNVNSLSVTEDFDLRPQDSDYGCSKINAENWLKYFQEKNGGRYLALRFCGFIDGGGFVDYVINQSLNSGVIELFSGGRTIRDYLHSNDGVEAIVLALQHSEPSGFFPINIGSGCALSAIEIAQLIQGTLGSKTQIELLNAAAPKQNFVFKINSARAILNFQPLNLDFAIRDYASSKLTSSRESKI